MSLSRGTALRSLGNFSSRRRRTWGRAEEHLSENRNCLGEKKDQTKDLLGNAVYNIAHRTFAFAFFV